MQEKGGKWERDVCDGNKIALITRSLSYVLVKQHEFHAACLAIVCAEGEGRRVLELYKYYKVTTALVATAFSYISYVV